MDNVPDEMVLEDCGGQMLPGSSGVRFRGWTFEVARDAILNTTKRNELSDQLGHDLACDVPMLPEAVFGANFLKITHEASGACVSFGAQASLAVGVHGAGCWVLPCTW